MANNSAAALLQEQEPTSPLLPPRIEVHKKEAASCGLASIQDAISIYVMSKICGADDAGSVLHVGFISAFASRNAH